jgi:PIN domain nuclease of toxin-antitoxin system
LAAIRDPGNEVLLSVVSVWEMQIKSQLGKLPLGQPLPVIIAQQQANGVQVLLVAQATIEGATVGRPFHNVGTEVRQPGPCRGVPPCWIGQQCRWAGAT